MHYVVLIAEALTVAWFATFILLVNRLAGESKGLAKPRLDRPGRAMLGSVRLAFLIGLGTVFVVEMIRPLGLLG